MIGGGVDRAQPPWSNPSVHVWCDPRSLLTVVNLRDVGEQLSKDAVESAGSLAAPVATATTASRLTASATVSAAKGGGIDLSQFVRAAGGLVRAADNDSAAAAPPRATRTETPAASSTKTASPAPASAATESAEPARKPSFEIVEGTNIPDAVMEELGAAGSSLALFHDPLWSRPAPRAKSASPAPPALAPLSLAAQSPTAPLLAQQQQQQQLLDALTGLLSAGLQPPPQSPQPPAHQLHLGDVTPSPGGAAVGAGGATVPVAPPQVLPFMAPIAPMMPQQPFQPLFAPAPPFALAGQPQAQSSYAQPPAPRQGVNPNARPFLPGEK